MADEQLGVEKDPKEGMDVFPVDETPTPTKILKLANDLFPDIQDPSKENPFDAHFRKAAEAYNQGSLSAGVNSSTEICTNNDSLNTPSIFPSSSLNTPTPIKSASSNSIGEKRPNNKPQKSLKPLLPNTKSIRTSHKIKKECEDAQLLLQTASGQTFKLFNVPVVPPTQVNNNNDHSSQASTSAGASGSPAVSEPQSKHKSKVADHPFEKEKVAELRERNRYSARRSRKRKQKYFDDLTKSQKNLALENMILREEIVKLKDLLQHHANCNVTLMSKSQDFREIIGANVFIQEAENDQQTENENVNSNEVDNEMDEEESVDHLHDDNRGISTLVCDMSGGTLQIVSDDYNDHHQHEDEEVHHVHGSTSNVLHPAQSQHLGVLSQPAQTYIHRKIYKNDIHPAIHYDKVYSSQASFQLPIVRNCYGSNVEDNIQCYTPIAPRPPPQTVAEDLTTNRVPSESETRKSSSSIVAKRKSSEPLYKPGKRSGSLGQKLKDIKDKMNQDRHIDEFLIQISDARSNALKD